MNVRRSLVRTLVAGAILVSWIGAASAEDISGLISATRTITQDSRLVGDVTCTVTGAPCIAFGSGHITLQLRGFTITGQADAVNACSGAIVAAEHGISTNGQPDVAIQGPGIVQRFRASGVFFTGTLLGRVEGITATTNCQSGIFLNATSSRISITANLSTRNGSSQAGAACGGI